MQLPNLKQKSHRAFAVSGYDNGEYWLAVTQFTAALIKYDQSNQPEMVARCLNYIIDCLEKEECRKQYQKEQDDFYDVVYKINSNIIRSF